MFGWLFPATQAEKERKRREDELAEYRRKAEAIRAAFVPFMESGEKAHAAALKMGDYIPDKAGCDPLLNGG